MKKLIVGFLFLITSIFDFGCKLGCGACKGCAFDKLSDNLFNKRVLEFYDIPWLKKPENITNESGKKWGSFYHKYKGYIQDEQSFWEYGEYIYDTFVEKDYTIGKHAGGRSSGELFNYERWKWAKKPTNYEDCCKSDIRYDSGELYAIGMIEIYYSEEGLSSKYNTEKGGYKMKDPMDIELLLQEENGNLLLTILFHRENLDVYMVK